MTLLTMTPEELERSYLACQNAARAAERQRIAAYVLDQLLGAGHDGFDVVLKPSLIRDVAEAIREGQYQ